MQIETVGELKRVMQDLPDDAFVEVFSSSDDFEVDFDVFVKAYSNGNKYLEIRTAY